jgi:hypothetical protein
MVLESMCSSSVLGKNLRSETRFHRNTDEVWAVHRLRSNFLGKP